MRAFVPALLFVLMTNSSVQADLLLDLRFTDSTTFKTVSSGDSVFVDLILSDPDGGILPGGMTLASEGLGTGGGLITQTGGAAVVTSAGSITEGPGFDPTSLFSPIPAAPPGVVDSVLVSGPLFPFPLPVGLGMSSITIATFELIATGAPGDMATLFADVLDPSGLGFIGNETFATFTDLDAVLGSLAAPAPGSSFGSVTVSIAGVPEPSTILAGLLIGGALVCRRRKATVT